MRPPITFVNQDARRFSAIELLIIIAMVSVIAGFAVVNYVHGQRTVALTNTAMELAKSLQNARMDSMRRNAKEINQMAQVKVFNRSMYSVAIDADGDGYLDTPLVTSLEKQGVEINGPFPKTFIFDWLGQTVDAQKHRSPPPVVTVGNGSGASAVKFSETGDIVVIPASRMKDAK
ncbi:MAG: Tfp pilus assembly protein FimT/FimU [Pyrinomonadaceae bacterium]